MITEAEPVRLFVTHLWSPHDDYHRVFEYLESARNFFYRNHSTPDLPPASADAEALREDLRRQIAPVEVVIGLTGLYPVQRDLFTFQLLFAQAAHKPVMLLKPFGSRQDVPPEIRDLANEVVEWDERGITDAIRRLARHEDTARYDTIEFKLD